MSVSPGEGSEPEAERPADARAQEMVASAARAFFAAAQLAPVGFRYRIDGEVPVARGLGSSVTVIAGVLAGLDARHGAGFGPRTDSLAGVRDSLLQMLGMLQEVNIAPTTQAAEALPKLHEFAAALIEQWNQFEAEELAPLKLQP